MDLTIDIFKKYDLSEAGANVEYGLIKNGLVRLTSYAHSSHNLVTFMLDEVTVKGMILQNYSKLSSYVKSNGLNTQLTIHRLNLDNIKIQC